MERVVVTGVLDGVAGAELDEHCRRQHALGRSSVVLDLTALRVSDRAGLETLVSLHEGRAGVVVHVTGARWAHFLSVLAGAEPAEMDRLRVQIRRLRHDVDASA